MIYTWQGIELVAFLCGVGLGFIIGAISGFVVGSIRK